jgi:gamma-glutamylaminecyclotransferase
MPHYVFAFGTLKKGFPLHEKGCLSQAEFLGAHRTRACFPLVIAGPRFAPMMFYEPGTGHRVRGELYRIDDRTLEVLDRLESIGKPGNFRFLIEVEPEKGGIHSWAVAYMKTRSLADPLHSNYLEVYEDRRFICPEGTRLASL